jgi:hypothetical protein
LKGEKGEGLKQSKRESSVPRDNMRESQESESKESEKSTTKDCEEVG